MDNQRSLLEIAANSLASAIVARDGGADRVELCTNLREGGTTPSFGSIAAVRDELQIPLYVLIRPRTGDFLYDESERGLMLRDIDACVRLGCDGVVLGALDAEGNVDMAACRQLIDAARPLGVTFHRAFDVANDQARALEDLIRLGCQRVLTSGACASAEEGAERIAALVRQASERICVMAGAGINADNILKLAIRTGAGEFHASASSPRPSRMRHTSPTLCGLDKDWTQTDAEQVRRLAAALASRLS